MVNPSTAVLGIANVALYAGVYTWMKRNSALNTWLGAVVGALPPLMGWVACDAHALSLLPLSSEALPPFALCMLLFSWQFPHFNSLSHFVRGSYAQAGYHMLSATNPPLNTLVSLRHTFLLIITCSALAPMSGLTTWVFAATSLFPNLICVHAAWRFWKRGGESEARALFQHSLWYLPVILALMMLHKQGVDWFHWVDGLYNHEDGFGVSEQKI
jgi:protoheme IX farnesyltransferase